MEVCVNHQYMSLKREADIIRIDEDAYDLRRGEMNPGIVDVFMEEILERELHPVVWEPFAGHTGISHAQDRAEDAGVRLISYDLEPSDGRVLCRDSTEIGPEQLCGGVIFHPPYFGSSDFSDREGEISNKKDKYEYITALSKTVQFCRDHLQKGGLVCAVGRDYRSNGKRIRLDEWFLELFESKSFKLIDVWLSEPDTVLILEK
jgi:hypothetical protein